MYKKKWLLRIGAFTLIGLMSNSFAVDKEKPTAKKVEHTAASKKKGTLKKRTKKHSAKKSRAHKTPRSKESVESKKTRTRTSPKKVKSTRKPTTPQKPKEPKKMSKAESAAWATLPKKIKDLAGFSPEASHTHTYASIAQRIAESGSRTDAQLKELMQETQRGQAPDAQKLANIAANYHNLGNFTEALAHSSPESVHKLMLETPNLKPLSHRR